MNLKESFQFQTHLQNTITFIRSLLSDPNVTCKTTKTYFYSKACKGAEDEEVDEVSATQYSGKADDLIKFLDFLLEEKVKLTSAIKEAKAGADIDIDSAVSLNSTKRDVLDALKRIANVRSSEEILPKGGMGYTFNNDGNQVSYRCDVKVVKSIDFNRKHVLGRIRTLDEECEKTSTDIDRALVSTEVAYARPFSVSESFDDIFENFCETKK